jgi:hypothetical protein
MKRVTLYLVPHMGRYLVHSSGLELCGHGMAQLVFPYHSNPRLTPFFCGWLLHPALRVDLTLSDKRFPGSSMLHIFSHRVEHLVGGIKRGVSNRFLLPPPARQILDDEFFGQDILWLRAEATINRERVGPCEKHPRYKAERNPRCDCPDCWALRRIFLKTP